MHKCRRAIHPGSRRNLGYLVTGRQIERGAAANETRPHAAAAPQGVGWIYDPDHSLPPGMYVDVPHLDCLLVATPVTVEGLDHRHRCGVYYVNPIDGRER
jgi:hypothetical protein